MPTGGSVAQATGTSLPSLPTAQTAPDAHSRGGRAATLLTSSVYARARRSPALYGASLALGDGRLSDMVAVAGPRSGFTIVNIIALRAMAMNALRPRLGIKSERLENENIFERVFIVVIMMRINFDDAKLIR